MYTNSQDFFMEFSEPSSGKYDEEFVKEFPYDNVSPKAKNEDLVSLLYTAGNEMKVYNACEECDSSYLTLLLKALGYFYNVCLNNYSKQKNDNTGNTKKLF